MSLGSSRTGNRLTVAPAAPVTRFVEPGPIEAVQANAPRRSAHLCVADGHVYDRLLVTPLEVWEIGCLLQGLAETRDYSVAENPGAAREEAALHSVPLYVLVL